MQTREKIYEGLKQQGRKAKPFTVLAQRCGCTMEWVRQVLSGKQQDDDLLEEASKLWLELEQAKIDKANRAADNADKAEELAKRSDSPS